VWLRFEGAAVFALAVLLYARGGHSWLLFARALPRPDLSLGAYVGGPRAGAWATTWRTATWGRSSPPRSRVATGRPPVVALLWAAHVGFDRALGYGLKYAGGFTETHLGRIGRRAAALRPRADEARRATGRRARGSAPAAASHTRAHRVRWHDAGG
jgi:hypothetical protein